MCSILHMTVTSLVVVVAPRTGKTKWLSVFERGEDVLQNGILYFVFKLSQSSESCYKFRKLHRRITDFSGRGLALNG